MRNRTSDYNPIDKVVNWELANKAIEMKSVMPPPAVEIDSKEFHRWRMHISIELKKMHEARRLRNAFIKRIANE